MEGDRRRAAKEDGRWPVAVGQAGSAVVSLARGRRVEIIVLGRSLDQRGGDPAPYFRGRMTPSGRPPPRTQRTVEDEIMTLLAASAAVRHASGDTTGSTPEAEYQAAVELAGEFSGSLEEAETFVGYLEVQTAGLLADERRWECVETFAELLLERGAIDGREARFVFQRIVFGSPREASDLWT
jgi:hypothetical protein